jgi:hypothetical protein
MSWRAVAIAVPAVCWAIGAIAFLRADGAMSWTLPQQAPAPQGEHNLASYKLGPTLRASSYYRAVLSPHHPAFVLDGRAHPTTLEKWTSNARDLHPAASAQPGRTRCLH